MDKNEYINRSAALQSSEILPINTKEYGKIDAVPVEYLQDLPITTFLHRNKSCSIVEIVKILNDERGVAEIKFHNVFVDDSGNGYFNYLLKTGGTMNASFKYLKIIIPGKVEEC